MLFLLLFIFYSKTLLSHRNGSYFLPTEIDQNLFETINSELIKTNEAELKFEHKLNDKVIISFENILNGCYSLDNILLPSKYRLKDLDYLVKRNLRVEQETVENNLIKTIWSKIEKKLVDLFQMSSKLCEKEGKITREQKKEFFYSVTEKEISEGILKFVNDESFAELLNSQTLVYIRNMNELDFSSYHSEDEIFSIGRYYEIEKSCVDGKSTIKLNKHSNKNLEKLKTRLRQVYKSIDSPNLKEFNDVCIHFIFFFVSFFL